jgi:type VI protein secretion system component VasK
MSDMPKNLQAASRARWGLAAGAGSLTVVAGVLGWNQVVTGGSPFPSNFVWGFALLLWFSFVAVCCTVFVCKRQREREKQMEKRAERAKEEVLAAIAEMKTAIAEIKWARTVEALEQTNIRSINERRR